MTHAEFTEYLENILIPSLRESGHDATADDFAQAALHIQSLTHKIDELESLVMGMLSMHQANRRRHHANEPFFSSLDVEEHAMRVADKFIRCVADKDGKTSSSQTGTRNA